MRLATAEQVKKLRASSVKRRDYDELGPNLYDCWLLTVIRYLEARSKRQASSVKQQATSVKQQADHQAQPSLQVLQAASGKRQDPL